MVTSPTVWPRRKLDPRRWAQLFVVSAAACSSPGETTPAASVNVQLPAAQAADAPAVAPPDDPAALTVVLTRAPGRASSQTVSLIGAPAEAGSAAAEAPKKPEVAVMQLQPDLKASNAGTERDLRRALYFPLVSQCRDEDGQVLPPESVELDFRVDGRGMIDRSSVRARAERPEHEAAARCMVRLVRTTDARFGPVRLDEPIEVHALVPSVD
ncbi:MAG: hypothetical protein HOW73_01835 [Polyangiaceae bacterium]|nr:hypothetical protein [Polyangiaceae bacterium]